MKTWNRKNWKLNALSASMLVATAAAGYTSVTAANSSASQTTAASATTGQTTTASDRGHGGRGQPPGGTLPGGQAGRGGDNHLQGLSTNPPTVELAPAQSSADATQSTDKAAGAAYYDGQYYGDAVSAGRWGTMQVVAVIEDGKLVDVQIADYPRSTYESDIITRNALPTLISEAVQAQDSNVNIVSRATDSSRAFIQSLNSALLDAAIGMDL
jgi:uncharacterized protein with FMN-binding domain